MKKLLPLLIILLATSSCGNTSDEKRFANYINRKLSLLLNDDFHEQVNPYSIYGMSLDKTGKYTALLKTIDSCYTALEATPNNVQLRTEFGKFLYENSLYHDATEQYALALEVDSTYLPAYYNLALCELNVGSNESAIELLQKAIRIDPRYAPSYYLWGTVLLHEEKYDKAIEKYEQAIAIDPHFQDAREGIELAEEWRQH